MRGRIISFLLSLSLLLTACGSRTSTPPPSVPANQISASQTPLAAPTGTSTLSPTGTSTPTIAPSSTFTPTAPASFLPQGARLRLGDGSISGIAFMPDGKNLAVSTAIGVYMFQTGTLEQVWSSPIVTGAACLAASLDGKILATGNYDGTVTLWDTATGDLLRTLTGNNPDSTGNAGNVPGRIFSLAFSQDDQRLAVDMLFDQSGPPSNDIFFWDVATGNQLATLVSAGPVSISLPPRWALSEMAFSPDGKVLAMGLGDGSVEIADATTGNVLQTLAGQTDSVQSVAFSPDGKTLASGSLDNTIVLWDTTSWKSVLTLTTGNNTGVWNVAFSPDGKTLASADVRGTITLWDRASGNQLRTLKGHTSLLVGLAFSPDGSSLASASPFDTLILWNWRSGTKLSSLDGSSGYVRSMAISSDGKILASGYTDHMIRLWDESTGKPLQDLIGHVNEVYCLAFSPRGKILASGSLDNTVILWDMSTGKPLHILRGFTDGVRSVAFSPDGNILATGSHNSIMLWDTATGALLNKFSGPGFAEELSFSPDGKTLAAGPWAGTVTLWDVESGKLLDELDGCKVAGNVTFASDGSMLATDYGSDSFLLCDLSTGTQSHILKANSENGDYFHMAFSPDGKKFAAESQFGVLTIFDVDTGEVLLTQDINYGIGMIFSLDGNTLAIDYGDGTIVLWNIAP